MSSNFITNAAKCALLGALATLLLISTKDHQPDWYYYMSDADQHGVYNALRSLAFTSFTVLAYRDSRLIDKTLAIIWAASALIINPFLPVAFGRLIWQVVDWVWIVFIVVSIAMSMRAMPPKNILWLPGKALAKKGGLFVIILAFAAIVAWRYLAIQKDGAVALASPDTIDTNEVDQVAWQQVRLSFPGIPDEQLTIKQAYIRALFLREYDSIINSWAIMDARATHPGSPVEDLSMFVKQRAAALRKHPAMRAAQLRERNLKSLP